MMESSPGIPAGAAERVERRAVSLIYGVALTFNVVLGMLTILVPLYVLHLGYSLVVLGAVVSSQAVAHLLSTLFGGVFSDRFGEQRVLWFSFGAIFLGSLVFAALDTLWVLIGVQQLFGASRTMYWTASQSYASRINEAKSGHILGRYVSFGSGGQVSGVFLGGVVAGTLGYPAAFSICAAVSAFGLLATSALPRLPLKAATRSFLVILAPIPGLLRRRALCLAGISAFGASLSLAFVNTIYPAYFEEIGFGEVAIGFLRSWYGGGTVVIGILFGALLARLGQKRIFAIGMGGTGAFLLLTPAAGALLWGLVPLLLAMGIAFGCVWILYTVMATQGSTPEQRGVVMAVVALYWSAAQLTGPIAFGVTAAALGLDASFWLAGGLFLGAALLTPLLFATLLPRRQSSGGPTLASAP